MTVYLHDGIRHTVRSQGSHHAQLLQGVLALPFSRKLFFLWALTVGELLPTFGRALRFSYMLI